MTTSEDELIKKIIDDFNNVCFKDIDRAIYGWESGQGCLMGAFILLSCVIDYLAKFAYGVDASKKGKTGEYYKKYINEYLKTIDSRYDANDLYHHLRCGLVHHYSTRYNGTARLLFTHDKPGINLKEDIDQNTSEKRVLLELFQFKDDIYKSSELLFKKIESDPKSKKLFIDNYRKYGFITTGIPFRVI